MRWGFPCNSTVQNGWYSVILSVFTGNIQYRYLPPRQISASPISGGALIFAGRDLNRATGSGARVNEPKTVPRTVFGEAKAPKQGAFRAVIYGGDGRRLATRRALACIARRDNLSFSANKKDICHSAGALFVGGSVGFELSEFPRRPARKL